MESYVYRSLEKIRPWFWQGDYNFLWLYLITSIILLHYLIKLKAKCNNYHTFRDERVHKHKLSMQEVWSKKQEELSLLTKTELKKKESEKRIEEEEEKKEKKQKEEKKEEKKGKKKEKEEDPDEKDEKLARLQRKTDYFSGSSGPSGYKPNLQDRYPQVYKRKGG